MRKTRAGKSNRYDRDVIVFKIFSVIKIFSRKAGVFKFSGLKSESEKLRFRDGLVWTVDLAVEIKLRFQSNFYVRRKATVSLTTKRRGRHFQIFRSEEGFEKLRFRDGLEWTVGLTRRRNMAAFSVKFLRTTQSGQHLS